MSPRSFGVGAIAIVLVAAGLRFTALDGGLPNPRTRPDELPVVQAMGRADRGEPLEMLIYPNAYVYASWIWVEGGLLLAPLYDSQPPGGFQKTLLVSPERIYWLGRTLSAFAGTLAVLVAIFFARREWGPAAALAAGWLVATCFLHARDSHALKPDALLSLTALLSLGASVMLAERASATRVATAGVALGLAMATKYTGLLMAAPLYVAGCLSSQAPGARRLVPASAVVAAGIAALVFAATSPELVFEGPLLELIRSIAGIVLPDLFPTAADASVVGAGLGGQGIFAPPPGVVLASYQDRSWYHGIVFHSTFSMWYGLGAVATLLAPFAVGWGFATRRPLPLLASVACLVQFLVMGLTPAVTARYLTQILPILLLLEAGMIFTLAKRFAGRRATLALAAATLLVATQPLLAILGHNRIASETDTRVLAERWLAQNVEPGAKLAYAGAVLMPYGQPIPPEELEIVVYGLDPVALDEKEVDYLVTHDHALYFSTVDREALAALTPRLRRVADFDPREGAMDTREAVFEATDAYYIPFHGFDRVVRPGPHIEIFAFDAASDAASDTNGEPQQR